jgi:hypothetical protein
MSPADLNKLRLLQGSCTRSNGGAEDKSNDPETPDALCILNDLIRESATDAFGRPHQLLLAGDQIYADEEEKQNAQ